MLVLVEGAAEVVTSADVEVGELLRIGDRWGQDVQRPASAMPWWGRWELSCCSNSFRAWSRWRWFQTRVPSSSSRRQVCTRRSHERVHPRHPDPAEYDLDPRILKDGAEQGGVLPDTVADHEPGPAAGILENRDEVPGGLRHPGGGRVRRRAQDADAPAGVPDHREHVQPRPGQGDRFEEVTCRHGIGLGARKVRPGAATPLGYRVDPPPGRMSLLAGATPHPLRALPGGFRGESGSNSPVRGVSAGHGRVWKA